MIATCGLAAERAPALRLPDGAKQAEETITAAKLTAPIRFLSDDLLEGRAPASRGDELTRLYIQSAYELLGLRPGADGAWQQPFEMVGITTRSPERWAFQTTARTTSLEHGEDFIANCASQRPSAAIEGAELVFAGYGIQAPEHGWDDFKDADLRGKVLLLLNNDPDWDPQLFAGERRLYYGRWDYKYENAARAGAAGAVLIHTRPSAGYPWQVVQSSWSGEQFELPVAAEARLQVSAWVTEAAARRLAQDAGHDLDRLIESAKRRDFRPVRFGMQTSLALSCELRQVRTANVLGLLPGADPALRQELVVYTAHHDHLGIGEADAEGDTIYNGAQDNATGVAQMLAIAEAFHALPQPPRRSVLFLAVGAEEQGLLGSLYYTRHPTVHPARIAANINLDGGNIWGRTADVALVGYGKSTLDGVAALAARRQGRTLTDEAFPDRGHFYRSDQFSFAKIGVPALYFDPGRRFIGRPEGWGAQQIEAWEDRHYHQPSDELGAQWEMAGLVEDAQLAFIAGLAIAQERELPRWRPGDEFEAVRLEALADDMR
jgi:Zn-dependent M28 family amino/carboxypeptidase